LRAGGGTLHRAYSIEALAQLAGLPPENLAATVADYNDAVRFNRLLTLLPERSTLSGMPRRIETPPFFAIPICAGITNTMGGIASKAQGRRRPYPVAARTMPATMQSATQTVRWRSKVPSAGVARRRPLSVTDVMATPPEQPRGCRFHRRGV
jgi:hypothetical protein